MPIIGFEPVMVSACLIINATYQFFLHTKSVGDLGLVGHVFNTPWVHQAHHSCNIEYLDKNHGGIFIFWDKLFGTFVRRQKSIEPAFGVIHDPGTYNPLLINVHEYRDIWRDVGKSPRLRDKLMYIFGPPGWSHDGSSKTTRQMQREGESGRKP
jgi:hypothetical protein